MSLCRVKLLIYSQRVISWRRVIAVVIAICAVIHTFSGLASAQLSPSAAKTKLQVGLSSRKLDFGKVPARTQSMRMAAM